MANSEEQPGLTKHSVDTGGGAYVGESVTTGGDFIGRDKITIFNVTIPRYLAWLLGLVLLAGLAVSTWAILGDDLAARLRPLRMDGRFNMVILEFGEIQPSGQAASSEDGADMSQWLFDGLTQSYNTFALDDPNAVWIWSRSSPEVAGHRARFGPLLQPDPEQRCAAAAGLAQEINAHLVIFGAIDKRRSPASFTLEFYASDDVLQFLRVNNIQTSAVYTNSTPSPASCLPIGEPLSLNTPLTSPSDREAVFRAVSYGSEFFFWLTLGLVREQLGLPQAALQNFLNLDAYFDTQLSRSDARRYGQDLVNFFIGQQYIFQLAGQFEGPQVDVAQLDLTLLDQAQAHFTKAQNLQGRHLDRALIGLGNVYYYIGSLAQAVRGQQDAAGQRAAPELGEYTSARELLTQAAASRGGESQLLVRAAQFYASAAAEAAATGDAHVGLIAELAQATTKWAEGQSLYLDGDGDAATPLLEEAVASVTGGEDPLLSRLEAWGDRRLVAKAHETVGLAYLQLADIARSQGQPEKQAQYAGQAVEAFQRCIDVAAESGAAQDAILTGEIIGDICQPYREIAADLQQASGEVEQ